MWVGVLCLVTIWTSAIVPLFPTEVLHDCLEFEEILWVVFFSATHIAKSTKQVVNSFFPFSQASLFSQAQPNSEKRREDQFMPCQIHPQTNPIEIQYMVKSNLTTTLKIPWNKATNFRIPQSMKTKLQTKLCNIFKPQSGWIYLYAYLWSMVLIFLVQGKLIHR